MNQDDLNTFETFLCIAAIITIITCALAANYLENRRQLKTPKVTPYGWGYFFSLSEMSSGLWAMLFVVVTVLLSQKRQWELCLESCGATAWFILHTICGWFIYRRKRWAWVVGTIANPNLFIWIINYFYARNRWKELS